jgi:hypothetical protein
MKGRGLIGPFLPCSSLSTWYSCRFGEGLAGVVETR